MIYPPQQPTEHKSSNLATLLVVGGLLVAMAVVFAPMFMRPRGGSLRSKKLSHAKQLLMAVQIYTEDHDGRLPLDTSSGRSIYAAIQPYVKNVSVLETLNPKSPEWLGNAGLGGKAVATVPDPFRTVLIFESAPYARDNDKEQYRTVGYLHWMARPVTESVFQEAVRNGFKTP